MVSHIINPIFLSSGTSIVATTWDPANKGVNSVLSNGNLTATSGSSTSAVRSVLGVASGKYYWETLISAIGGTSFPGIVNGSFAITGSDVVGTVVNSWGYDSLGRVWNNGVTVTTFSSYAAGARLSWAIDAILGSLWVAINGVWQNSGNPGAGTGAIVAGGMTGTEYAAFSDNVAGGVSTANFGSSAFTYPVPSGFTPGLAT